MYLTPDALDRMADDHRAHRTRDAERERLLRARRGRRARTSTLARMAASLASAWPLSSSPRRSTQAQA